MRRGALAALVVVALSSACASDQRPEGVVERWLLSLSQGAAGTPDRFGGPSAVAAADAVLPDWRTRDPGTLDRVQVGSAGLSRGTAAARSVPFRIETTDGEVITGAATVHPCPSSGGWCIDGASVSGAQGTSDWTWSAGARGWAWAWAVVAAVVLALAAVLVVFAVRKTAALAPDPH